MTSILAGPTALAHNIPSSFLWLILMLQTGDVLTAVDGLNVEAETVETVTALLRGSSGSQVRERDLAWRFIRCAATRMEA
jgi:C-terminal processing protease CtpA/Prc